MSTLLTVAGLLRRGGSAAERARARLAATGAALATWFLFGAADILTLHGQLDQHLGPIADPGTRGGTAFGFALMLLPVGAFLHQSGRLATADRERRLAALRLAGATAREVRLLGAFETTRAATAGMLAGAAVFLLVQSLGPMALGTGTGPAMPLLLWAVAMALVVMVAAAAGLLAGRHVITTPLGVTRHGDGRPPSRAAVVALLPVAAAVLAILARLVDLLFGREIVPVPVPLVLAGLLLLVSWPLLCSTWLVWYVARVTARRARTATTLLAARALESDARSWGRTMAVVALAVAISSGAGWFEAFVVSERHRLEPFWLTSFAMVDLALTMGIVIACAALIVHQAEYLLERSPMLATLHAGGATEEDLRRVLVRQALIASVPPCVLAAATGLIALSGPVSPLAVALWPLARGILMTAIGVLAAVLAARASRRRLRRAISAERLRTE